MDDKTQESKKTVVAFVAGLLIGGLLVWLFSGSPETAKTTKGADSAKKDTSAMEETSSDKKTEEATSTDVPAPKAETVHSDFSFTVADQTAGTIVSLGDDVKYPNTAGWIVVHADAGGKTGSALGAARYETSVGLTPKSVELLRATEASKTYHVVFYTDNGDRTFDMKLDTPMTTPNGGLVETTFVAQ